MGTHRSAGRTRDPLASTSADPVLASRSVSKRYLVDVFERLGYRYRAKLTEQHMRQPNWPRHPWFDHNMVGVLERWTPLVGDACSG